MRLYGALLIILSGAAAGFSAGENVRRTMSLAGFVERMMERFRNLVCFRRMSLPEAVIRLHEEYPLYFPGRDELDRNLLDAGFGVVWEDTLRRWDLPAGLSAILLPLGHDLASGEEPERCMDRVLGELRSFREENRAWQREALRLYPLLGLTGGCLLAILLL